MNDKLTDACRACLAALRGQRSGRELYHLQLTIEEAWKRAKVCEICREEKEVRDFFRDTSANDGTGSRCRGCRSNGNARYRMATGSKAMTPLSVHCPCCGEVKVACEFSTSKQTSNGLQAICKPCFKEYMAERHKKTRNSELHIQRQWKLCSGCGKMKQRSAFATGRWSLDGLQHYCKTCRARQAKVSKDSRKEGH